MAFWNKSDTEEQEPQATPEANEPQETVVEATIEPEEKVEEDAGEEPLVNLDSKSVLEFLGSTDGKKLLQPMLDKYFFKGLETWKTNNLDKVVQAKMEEINPSDPKEKEIQRLGAEMKQREITYEAQRLLSAKRLPIELSEVLAGKDIDTTMKNVTAVSNYVTEAVDTLLAIERDRFLKSIGKTPTNYGSSNNQYITKDDLTSMDYNERVKFYNDNPIAYARIMNG